MIIALEKHLRCLVLIFSEGAELSSSELERLDPSQESFSTLQDFENNS